MPIGQREDVVEISAHFRGVAMKPFDRVFTGLQAGRGQQRALNLARQLELVREALPLEHFRLRRSNARRHLVHRRSEQTELGAILERHGCGQIALPDALESFAKRAERAQQHRHEQEGTENAGAEKAGEKQDLIAARAQNRLIDRVAPHRHHRGADRLAAGMANRRRGEKRAVIGEQHLSFVQRSVGWLGQESVRHDVRFSQSASVGMGADHVLVIDDCRVHEPGDVGLHVGENRLQRQLGKFGEQSAGAGDGQISRFEDQSRFQLARQSFTRAPFPDSGDQQHRHRSQKDRRAAHDPANAEDSLPAARLAAHGLSPKISRERESCSRARAR